MPTRAEAGMGEEFVDAVHEGIVSFYVPNDCLRAWKSLANC